MILNRITVAIVCTGSLFALASCSGEDQTPSAARDTESPQWVLTSEPAGAGSIAQARGSAAEGDEVVLRGRIGGRKQPMAAESAVFTIVDLQLPYCGQHSEDSCSTPWDYCCETPEDITSNAATVQLIDANGTVIDGSPMAFGFEPLDEVVIVGTVAPRPNEQVLTVLAHGMYKVD